MTVEGFARAPTLKLWRKRPKLQPSTLSINQDGELIENAVVVKDIEKTLALEFCFYGYRNMTAETREIGWIINHKKVYRLMKESKLLYGAGISDS